jgi:hypothetical protein
VVGVGLFDPADDFEEPVHADLNPEDETWIAGAELCRVSMGDYAVSVADEVDKVVDVMQSVASCAPFKPTEVVFDSGAGRSVINNRALMGKIETIAPLRLRGIGGAQMVINRGGNFAGLKKAHRVCFNPGAVVSVLSQGTLVDEKHKVSYLVAPIDE